MMHPTHDINWSGEYSTKTSIKILFVKNRIATNENTLFELTPIDYISPKVNYSFKDFIDDSR